MLGGLFEWRDNVSWRVQQPGPAERLSCKALREARSRGTRRGVFNHRAKQPELLRSQRAMALARPDDGPAKRKEIDDQPLRGRPEGLDQLSAGPPQLSHAVRICKDGLVRPHERIQLLLRLRALPPRAAALATRRACAVESRKRVGGESAFNLAPALTAGTAPVIEHVFCSRISPPIFAHHGGCLLLMHFAL